MIDIITIEDIAERDPFMAGIMYAAVENAKLMLVWISPPMSFMLLMLFNTVRVIYR